MDRSVRRVAAAATVLLIVGLLVLLWRGPRFTTSGAYELPVSVRCASAMVVGWPTDGAYLQEEDRFDHFSDHTVGQPKVSQTQRLGIIVECSDRRTTNLSFAILLGTAAAVTASLALSGRRP